MSSPRRFRSEDKPADFRISPGVRVLDRYELIDLLGMGGTANVWRARMDGSGLQVGIKIQNPGRHTGAQRAERLEREFQILNIICSPYVVASSDCGHLPDGRAAVVFEYMRGQTLRELMEDQDIFELREALLLMSQLLRALIDVHEQGIIHRDIKPDNIMILDGEEGPKRLKLFDFGIAKIITESARLMSGLREPEIAELLIPLTSAEMTVGTPEYMAPEQISATNIGDHTDLYAVGIVLYEMLFGEVPYTGRNFFEIAHKHLAGVLPPLPADLPEQVHTLLWRSLACQVEDRYATAEEMLRDLDVALALPEVSGGWSSMDEQQVESLNAFIADDMMGTWTDLSESGMAQLQSTDGDSGPPPPPSYGPPPSVTPDEWLDRLSVTNQVTALQALEAQVTQNAERPNTEALASSRRVQLSSTATRALSAQLLGDEAKVPPKPKRPQTRQLAAATRPPWEVQLDNPQPDAGPTEELSLTDMLAVLSDREEEPESVDVDDRTTQHLYTARKIDNDQKPTGAWQESFMDW